MRRGLIDFNPPGRGRTSKERPIIPISGRLMTFLRLAKQRGTDLGTVIEYRGEPIGDIKHGFTSACARAGLADVTPHTLRHTAASWMAQSGVPFPVIRAISRARR
jgi:integrase